MKKFTLIIISFTLFLVSASTLAAGYSANKYYIVTTISGNGQKHYERVLGSELNKATLNSNMRSSKKIIIEPDVVITNPISNVVPSQPSKHASANSANGGIFKKQPPKYEPLTDELFATNQAIEWGFEKEDDNYWTRAISIDTIKAFELVKNSENIRMGVIDGGFYPNEDMNVLGGYSFMDDVSEGEDGTTFVVERGINYWSDDYNTCEVGHGIGVASVSSATANNEYGMAGLVNSDIYVARALHCGSGWLSEAATAIRWLSGQSPEEINTAAGDYFPELPQIEKMDVINMSIGGFTECPSYLQDAIDFAYENNVIIVVAASNASGDVADFAPANCDKVITVAAGHSGGGMESFSNTGEEVDITAKGEGVLGYQRGLIGRTDGSEMRSHTLWSGTSFASPMVAGTVGMLRQLNRDISHEEVLMALEHGAEPIRNDFPCPTEKGCGFGWMNIGTTITSYNMILQNGYGTIEYAMNDAKNCDAEVYSANNLFLSRMCSLVKVNLLYYENSVFDSEPLFVIYRASSSAQLDISTAEIFYEDTKANFLLNGVDVEGSQFGYRVLVNGEYLTQNILPLRALGDIPKMCNQN